MPGSRGQLYGRAYLVADQMNGIEVLSQADEVAVVLVIAWPAPALAITNIGRTCDQPEIEMIAAHDYALFGVAWGKYE